MLNNQQYGNFGEYLHNSHVIYVAEIANDT